MIENIGASNHIEARDDPLQSRWLPDSQLESGVDSAWRTLYIDIFLMLIQSNWM